MKIITEKINSLPAHSITKKDVELVLKHVPQEAFGVATIFKISAQIFSKSKWDRPVVQNGTTYNILSRGLEKEFIIKELLIEIYVHLTKIYGMYAHRLSKEQRKNLEELVQPVYEMIINELK